MIKCEVIRLSDDNYNNIYKKLYENKAQEIIINNIRKQILGGK